MKKLKYVSLLLGLVMFFVLSSLSSGQTPSYDPGLPDTLLFEEIDYYLDGPPYEGRLKVPVIFFNDEELTAMTVPFVWSGAAVLDSANYIGSRAIADVRVVDIDSLNNKVLLAAVTVTQDPIPPGRGLFSTLYFSISDTGYLHIDTTLWEPNSHVEFTWTSAVSWPPQFAKLQLHLTPDTVFFGDIDYYLDPDDLTGKLEVPVIFVNGSSPLAALSVPLLWIGSGTLDSVSFTGGRVESFTSSAHWQVDNDAQKLEIYVVMVEEPWVIEEGRGLLGTLFFNLSDSGWFEIDTTFFGSNHLVFVDESHGWTPEFVKSLFHFIPSFPGDANHDGSVGLADVVFMINYLFRGGPSPVCSNCTDVDCDCEISLVDVVYLINYLFRSGDPPQVGCVLPL